MTLFEDIKKQMDTIQKRVNIAKIEKIFIPTYPEQEINGKNLNSKKNNFVAIGLTDGAVGFSYMRYLSKAQVGILQLRQSEMIGKSPFEFIGGLGSDNVIDHIIGIGIVNAISQSFFYKNKFP